MGVESVDGLGVFKMSVTQLRSSIASMGTDMAVVSLAMGIVQDRVQRLSGDDRADLFELVKDFAKAKSKEDVLEILDTIMEILDGEDHRIEPMDLPVDGKVNAAYKTFVGERIRASRTAAGMTQEQLAEKTDLPQSHISRIENGKHSPSRFTLQKIAVALGKVVADFDFN